MLFLGSTLIVYETANQVDEAYMLVPSLVLGIGVQVAGGDRAERGQGGLPAAFAVTALG